VADFIDINALADDVLRHVASQESVKTAAEDYKGPITQVGIQLKKLAETIKSLDLNEINNEEFSELIKSAAPTVVPTVTSNADNGTAHVGLRKISHELQCMSVKLAEEKRARAMAMLDAAVSLKHLKEL